MSSRSKFNWTNYLWMFFAQVCNLVLSVYLALSINAYVVESEMADYAELPFLTVRVGWIVGLVVFVSISKMLLGKGSPKRAAVPSPRHDPLAQTLPYFD